MDRRVALVQYDASGAVLQAATCFVSAAPGTPAFLEELKSQMRSQLLSRTARIDAVIGRDDPLLIGERDDLERSVH